MKVFKIYFLALLLIFAFPVNGQENTVENDNEPEKSVSEDTDEKNGEEEDKTETLKEEAKPEEAKPEEAKPEEAKPEEAKPDEAKPEEAAEPLKPQTVEPEAKEEPKLTVKTETAPENEKGENDEKGEEKEENKKFNLSLTNGFSHGLAKERKSFSYNLNLGASYTLPWQMAFSADVGLNALYRYDMESAVALESGDISNEKVDYGKFDGTPLNIGLSKRFPLFWKIGGSLGISAGLPFTSTEMWEQYKIYTMLSANLGLLRSFKVAKETSVNTGFSFTYTKTFAKEDYAWDDYQNTPLDSINEHNMVIGLSLSLAYKGLALSLGGGYNISKSYSVDTVSFNYGDKNDNDSTKSNTTYQPWSYTFSFRAAMSYTLKEWSFGLGVMTNAPEYESGNYAGFDSVAGDKEVKNPSSNYPFKAKYTRVFANIGYSYSF